MGENIFWIKNFCFLFSYACIFKAPTVWAYTYLLCKQKAKWKKKKKTSIRAFIYLMHFEDSILYRATEIHIIYTFFFNNVHICQCGCKKTYLLIFFFFLRLYIWVLFIKVKTHYNILLCHSFLFTMKNCIIF